jgi:hypothetical protein
MIWPKKTFSEPITEFVKYFAERASQIDAKIYTGDRVDSEMCELITETVQHASRELYFPLLRAVCHRWAPLVDVNNFRQLQEAQNQAKLLAKWSLHDSESAFYQPEIHLANDAVGDPKQVSFLLNTEVMSVIDSAARHPDLGYSSVDSLLRHAVIRHILWLNESKAWPDPPNLLQSYAGRIRQIEKTESESHFYVAIEVLRKLFWGSRLVDLRDLDRVRDLINSFESPCWKQTYLEEFDKHFGVNGSITQLYRP